METGLLHLHNLLRWVVLIAIVVAIVQLLLKKDALKASKVLLISAHSTLVLGLYQYFFGPVGFFFIKNIICFKNINFFSLPLENIQIYFFVFIGRTWIDK